MAQIIGIGGISQSGKSTMARRIKEMLPKKRVLILEMDAYVFPEAELPKIKGIADWDRPESMDFDKIIAAIIENQSSYDLILVEGILPFANDYLRRFYNVTVFSQISKETFLQRRKIETRWGQEPEWYWEHVWDSYLKFGQYPTADYVLSGEEEIPESMLQEIINERGNLVSS